MKKSLLILILLAGNLTIAQTIIRYKMPQGHVISKENFDRIIKGIEKQHFEYKVIDSIIKKDTLTRIIDIKPEGYFKTKENNEKFNPHARFEKNKGLKFKISEFYNYEGKKILENRLIGKPTIINFWFIGCAPCVKELPYFKKLKTKFENKLNYLAITFDSKSKVDEFLTKNEFDFLHITDSKKQINDLGINGYPLTFILDNEGKINEIFGSILNDSEYKEIIEIIEKKLL
ncbi:TlpA disulfide reductase family protein [uncultured Polaribacter sp.]|uniref:TlpA family protein disulfide reductase n=1 Tax=uncultured Polaribacter sp. TaxID=174711 RepID=UPI002602CA44|nr:TlpA disulfide reductase family protein [uncultured Polaribacter sp.]